MIEAILSLGGLGFLLSLVLAVAYAKLGIKLSQKEKQILDSLPGANCGACGFPGCEGYAQALIEEKADIGACPVGGKELVDELSKIMGVEGVEVEPKSAVVRCQGSMTHTYERFNYIGIKNCLGSDLMAKGYKSCVYGCLGFGDCVEVCKFGAIKIGKNGLPVIDEKNCTGCGKCVEVCPRKIIELIPATQKIYVGCSSPLPVKLIKKSCKTGCISCRVCEKNCPYEAIKVKEGVARIHFERCENCGICIYKCPTHIVIDKLKSRPKAMIGTKCTGCEECKSVCPMKAIDGKAGEQHKVIFEKCIGCGLCYKKCEDKAITMAFSLGYTEVEK
jgi:electron transport complex protein RnfB